MPWRGGFVRWRRFINDHGIEVFLVALVAGVLVLVALLMYALTATSWY